MEPRLDQALLLVASEGGALDLLAGYASFQAARRPGAWSATAEPTPRNLCIDAVYTLSVYLSL